MEGNSVENSFTINSTQKCAVYQVCQFKRMKMRML